MTYYIDAQINSVNNADLIGAVVTVTWSINRIKFICLFFKLCLAQLHTTISPRGEVKLPRI